MTEEAGMFDGSEPWENSVGVQETGDDQQRLLPLPTPDLWQASRELKWQIFLASKFGGLFSRVNPAGCHGKIFWRVILADLFGGFS